MTDNTKTKIKGEITAEDFARMAAARDPLTFDKCGNIVIRTERPQETDPGLTLRKRRAWYSA